MGRDISGVLLLDKPYGITSNRALQIVKRLFSANKSGHVGTLDPIATGLLPVCFGEATKFSFMLLEANKTYQATMNLGYVSSTGDSEGIITAVKKDETKKLTLEEINRRLQRFVGKIQQLPPMYSALKLHGKPLYFYARKGLEVKRKTREVMIHNLQADNLDGNRLKITVKCGSGTYIRSLAEDIGRAVGYGGAYLSALSRCNVGNACLSMAVTLDLLESQSMVEREACLYDTDYFLNELETVMLNIRDAERILNGCVLDNRSEVDELLVGNKIRLYDCNGRFLGLGEISDRREIVPKRMVAV